MDRPERLLQISAAILARSRGQKGTPHTIALCHCSSLLVPQANMRSTNLRQAVLLLKNKAFSSRKAQPLFKRIESTSCASTLRLYAAPLNSPILLL